MEKRKDARGLVRRSERERTVRDAKVARSPEKTICINSDCKLRKAGCKGAEGCPGYKAG